MSIKALIIVIAVIIFLALLICSIVSIIKSRREGSAFIAALMDLSNPNGQLNDNIEEQLKWVKKT